MSKLGPYYLTEDSDFDNDSDRVAFVNAGCPIIKVHNSRRHLPYFKKQLPGAILLGRHDAGENAVKSLRPDNSSPEHAAQVWMDAMAAIVDGASDATYWCSPYNEWGLLDPSGLAWLAAMHVAWMKLLVARNRKAAPGGFSSATMLFDKWLPYKPALEAALTYGFPVDLHGYNSPDANNQYTDHYLFPHRPLRDQFTGQYAYLRGLKYVYGEFGADRLPDINQIDGWRLIPGIDPWRYAGFYANDPQHPEITVPGFLPWCDQQMMADPDVLGAAVFLWTRKLSFRDVTMYNMAVKGRGDPVNVGDVFLGYIQTHQNAALPLPTPQPIPGPTTPPVTPPPAPAPKPTPPYPATTVGNLYARLGMNDTDPSIAILPSGTPVTVLTDGARRARIEVSVLGSNLKPK